MPLLEVKVVALEANFLQALLRARFNDLPESDLELRLLAIDIFAALCQAFVPDLLFAQVPELLQSCDFVQHPAVGLSLLCRVFETLQRLAPRVALPLRLPATLCALDEQSG